MDKCEWCLKDQMYEDYHDSIWGIPEYDGIKLFKMLCLTTFQAGLSWHTILLKKAALEAAFDEFDPYKVSCYGEDKILELMANKAIIRSDKKIRAVINNAQLFVLEDPQMFSDFIWSFVGFNPIINNYKTIIDIPTSTPESISLSRALKQKGYKYVGPIIIHSYMESMGLYHNHLVYCQKHIHNLVEKKEG